MNRLAIRGATIVDTVKPTADPVQKTIVIEDGRIVDLIAPDETVSGEVIDATGLWAIPGMIDLHFHPFLVGIDPSIPRHMQSLARNVDLCVEALGTWLDSGVTTVRSAGAHENLDLEVRDLLRVGRLRGPRMQASGNMITMTAGLRMGNENAGLEVSGPDEARMVARRQLKAGVDWLKIYASSSVGGGGGRLIGPPGWPQLGVSEIAAIVEEGRNAGVPCMAHASSAPAVTNCLKAGVQCIEHATHIDEEGLSLLVETDTPIVPTLAIGWSLATFGIERGFGEHIQKMAAAQQEDGYTSMMKAKRAGVRVGTGTDADNTKCLVREECRLMVDAGFTPYEALQAATIRSSEILGRSGDLGGLAPGFIADVVLIAADPLSRIENLAEVNHVIKDGEIAFSREVSA